jgi:hypothetical protein
METLRVLTCEAGSPLGFYAIITMLRQHRNPESGVEDSGFSAVLDKI